MNALIRKQIFKNLAANNPNPRTELVYNNHFELLIAVMLSAQATDISVNRATKTLFTVANTPEKMLALGEKKLKTHIQSIGLYNSKAKNILATSQLLIKHHASTVPPERTLLEALPGVGHKTASVILNEAFNQPTIAVDTHVFRVSKRLKLANGKTPLAVEKQLMRTVPKVYQSSAHHLLILHGRYTCTARKPKCPQCVLNKLCPYPEKST